MRPYLIALLCVCAAMSELASAHSSSQAWRRFKSEHAKVYGPKEDAMRFANFLATKQLVERHNANPNATYKMRLNHMADWTRQEQQQLMGFRMSEAQRMLKESSNDATTDLRLIQHLDKPALKEVDWRNVPNRVSSVKDQKKCGSCWAFATTGLLEGQETQVNISSLIPLSEQELVDCSTSNHGCSGGSMVHALIDIGKSSRLDGIESEADYPYNGLENDCKIDKSKSVMKIKRYLVLKDREEEALMKTLSSYGPVAVAMDATENLIHYSSGVFIDSTCSSEALNHAVLLVGYGTDAEDGDFWIVKNSWSAKWGQEGYFKIRRGVNECGIAMIPTLAATDWPLAAVQSTD